MVARCRETRLKRHGWRDEPVALGFKHFSIREVVWRCTLASTRLRKYNVSNYVHTREDASYALYVQCLCTSLILRLTSKPLTTFPKQERYRSHGQRAKRQQTGRPPNSQLSISLQRE